MVKPHPTVAQNTWSFLRDAMITPTGFREYDARWKYEALERIVAKITAHFEQVGTIGGRAIKDVITVNGARIILENGAWGLVQASSNTPNLVVVCESPESEAEMRDIFANIDAIIRTEPSVGAYDQTI